MRLGYAAGKVLASGQRKAASIPPVLIGKDTRVSGYMLEAALEAGLVGGRRGHVAGRARCRRPAVAYLTRALRLSAGIVISASHNPYDDNGIKFFSGDGAKLPDATESAIERELEKPLKCMTSAKLGKARRIDDAAGRYIEFCKSTFPDASRSARHAHRRRLRPRRGLSHRAARVSRAGRRRGIGRREPDGFNINDECRRDASARRCRRR